MSKERKYKQGKPYKDIKSLLTDLNDKKYVYWIDKVKHPSIIINMTLRTIDYAIKRKMIIRAEINIPHNRKTKNDR